MKRDRSIDLLRATGIIVMIMAHVDFGTVFYQWSHAFHMPLFFIVSGYFFSEVKAYKDTHKYILKKAKSLLIPYFVFALGSYIVWLILERARPVFDPLYNIFWYNSEGIPIATAVWFLTCLFFLELLFIAIYKISKLSKKYNFILELIFVIVLASVGIIIRLFCGDIWKVIPFSILQAVICLPFYFFGRLLSKYAMIIKLQKISCVLLFIIVFSLVIINLFLIFYNDAVNIRTLQMGNIFLFYLNAILSTCIIWFFADRIERMKSNRFLKAIESIGCNSIVYLCLNQAFITVIRIIAQKIGIDINNYIYKTVSFLLVMSILFISVIIINHTKIRVFFGGKHNGGKDSGSNT